MSAANTEREGARRPASTWGHRLTSACVALASGMAVNQLSNTLGYKGVAGASAAAGIVAGVFWLRRLPPRAPLLRYSFRALLLSALVAVVAAFVMLSTWTAYLAFAAIGLTVIAASLTINFYVSCAVLGGASAVGAGVAVITDGLALSHHVTATPVLEPLAKTPEPIVVIVAGALAIGGGVALVTVRDTARVAPLMPIGIAIAVSGLALIAAGRSSFAAMTLVPAGLAISGFGIAIVGVAGLFAFWDTKTPPRAIAACVASGMAIIAFGLIFHSGWETLPERVSTIALGGSAVGLGIGVIYWINWWSVLALAGAGVSIIVLGAAILMHPYSSSGKASIGTGVAIAGLGMTVLLFIGVPTIKDLGKKILKPLTSDPSGS